MAVRKWVTLGLSLFVVASIFVLVRGEVAKPGAGEPASAAVDGVPANGVVAYYFHGTSRCRTCLAIESGTRDALGAAFARELADGALAWRPLNVEEPRNEHFVQDFDLSERTVVLARMEDGKPVRWTRLDRVWELVGDDEAFAAYVQQETREYLGL